MRMKWPLIVLTACVAAATLHAQTSAPKSAAWFGTPLPPPLNDPRKPIMKYDDGFAPLQAEFRHRPGRHDELLDGAALKADERRIVDFSLESLAAGDKVWGRRAATPAFMHTIEWVVGTFKSAGLAGAAVESFPVQGGMWVPESWRVAVVGDEAFGAGTETVALQSAFPQPGGTTIAGGSLTAPVVYVGR